MTELVGSFGLPGVAESSANRFQAALHDGSGIEVKGALLVTLALVGGVINPDRWNAEVLDRQQAVGANQAAKILGEEEQAWVRLTQSIEVTRI